MYSSSVRVLVRFSLRFYGLLQWYKQSTFELKVECPAKGTAVPEFPMERRQQRPFRILYMPLHDFLRRFVLRGKSDQVVPSPKTRSAKASAPNPEKATPWKCGVARLDDGNQVLFKAIRQFQGALKAGAEPGAMDGAVTFLKDHTDRHLALEEAYM